MVELNGTLLISILNFIILVAVLAHFCYKPVLKVMDDRRNKIRNDLDSAARSSAEAAKLKSDLKAELANAQVAAQGIVDKAVKEAKVQAQAQIDEAHAAIEREKVQAAKQIERERKDALEDLKTQVAAPSREGTRLCPTIAIRIVASTLSCFMYNSRNTKWKYLTTSDKK